MRLVSSLDQKADHVKGLQKGKVKTLECLLKGTKEPVTGPYGFVDVGRSRQETT